MQHLRAIVRVFRRYGLLMLGAIVAGLLFAWSGLYDVAASSGHWRLTEALLEFGLRSSVRTHSLKAPSPPRLDDPGLIRRGAAHFAGGCGPCHGAPRHPPSPIVDGLMPSPPPLTDAALAWRSRELFYIVKHGLKYTGMPAWPAQERDDEVWALVAFLQRLPTLQPAEYRAVALGGMPADPDVDEILRRGAGSAALSACARCHGNDGRGFADGAFPDIGGQSEAYLLQALDAYADGRRPSGIMGPVAASLSTDQRRVLARYYAGRGAMRAPIGGSNPAPVSVARGETIAQRGIPEREVPPCAPCHGPTEARRHAFYPTLVGQYAAYIEAQLALWRAGQRQHTALEQIMAPIGKVLSAEDAEAVAAYYASLPAERSPVERAP